MLAPHEGLAHPPATQARPAAHAGPAPQRQAPSAPQWSAPPDRQLEQAPPCAPQCCCERASQVSPEQHPPEQLVELHPLHAPFAQLFPVQFAQATPAFPQAFFCWPGWQLVPEQHPAQVTPSHTQAPPTQCCPGEHMALAPHRQAPALEQPSAARSHALQAPPFAPQVENDRGSHVVPEQQPSAQEVGVQTHAPLLQTCPAAHLTLPPQVHSPATEQPSALASHASSCFPRPG